MNQRAGQTVYIIGAAKTELDSVQRAVQALGINAQVLAESALTQESWDRVRPHSKHIIVVGSPLKNGKADPNWRPFMMSVLRQTRDGKRLFVYEGNVDVIVQIARIDAFLETTATAEARQRAAASWPAAAGATVAHALQSQELTLAESFLYAALTSACGVENQTESVVDAIADAGMERLDGAHVGLLRASLAEARLKDARRRLQRMKSRAEDRQDRLNTTELQLLAAREVVAKAEQTRDRLNYELAALTSSKAWRMTTPVRNARKAAGISARVLRRRTFAMDARPLSQVTEMDEPNVWMAESDDPQLLLTTSAGRLPYGWTLVDLTLEARTVVAAHVTLFVDYGEGFDPAAAIRLPHPHNGRITQVIHFKRGLRALRLDPTGSAGSFVLKDIALTEITSAEATARLANQFIRNRQWTKGDALRLARKAVKVWRKEGLSRVLQLARGDDRAVIDTTTYGDWIARFERLSDNDIARIKRHIESMVSPPLISIIVPTYNTPERWLIKAIESVRSQLYPHWELCIADDASSNEKTVATLQRYAALDRRIKVVFRKENGHISRASNSALEVATGEFVALLDHDDELTSHALYMVAEAIRANPNAGLIYSDEDKIDIDGRRYDPYFKPDWNPDLFIGQNFVSHLGVYRRALVYELGGFRPGFEGSQDYDLALRVVEKLNDGQIVHIPAVLYHWRSIPGSTALGAGEKNYALEAAGRALIEHVERTGIDASIEKLSATLPYHRIRYRGSKPRAAIIIPTKDRVDLLSQAIDSIIAKTDYPSYEIIVVDNRSELDESRAYFAALERDKRARVLTYDHPFNYSAVNNFAVRHTDAPMIALLNNDIEVIAPGWLTEMVAHAVRPTIGCVGAMLYYPDDRIQHAGVILGINGVAGHAHRLLKRGTAGYFTRAALTQNLSVVTAACLVIRRSIYEEVGGLDEGLKVAFNDVDFCLRVRAKGYRNLWTPHAELYHHESATRGSDDRPEHRERFASEVAFMKARWSTQLVTDPAYNPNLSLTDSNFAIAQPPRAPKPWHSSAKRRTTASAARTESDGA